jgi:hypothetical protein
MEILCLLACVFIASQASPDNEHINVDTEQAITRLIDPCVKSQNTSIGFEYADMVEGKESAFRNNFYYMTGSWENEISHLTQTEDKIDNQLLAVVENERQFSIRYRALLVLSQRNNHAGIKMLSDWTESSCYKERRAAWYIIRQTSLLNNEGLILEESVLSKYLEEQNILVAEEFLRILKAYRSTEINATLRNELRRIKDDIDYTRSINVHDSEEAASSQGLKEAMCRTEHERLYNKLSCASGEEYREILLQRPRIVWERENEHLQNLKEALDVPIQVAPD